MFPFNFAHEKRRLLKTHKQFDGFELGLNEHDTMSNQLVSYQSLTNGSSLVTYAAIDAFCSLLIKDERKKKAYSRAICGKLREFNLLDGDRVFESLVPKEKICEVFGTFMRQMTADGLSANNWAPGDELILSTQNESTFCIHSYYKDHFLEIEEIAKGGFGVVCKAQHKLDNILYAVKKIHFKYTNDLYFKKVIREATSFAALRHENIVNYNHAWIENHIGEDIKDSNSSSNSASYSAERVFDSKEQSTFSDRAVGYPRNGNNLKISGISNNLPPCYNLNYVVTRNSSENTMVTSSVTVTSIEDPIGLNRNVSINQSFEEEDSFMFCKTNYHSNGFSLNSSDENGVSFYLHGGNSNDCVESETLENEHLTEDHSHNVRRLRHSSGATCSTADESTVCTDKVHPNLNCKSYNRVHSLELPKGQELVPLAKNVSWDIRHLNVRATLYIQMELCDKNLRQVLDEKAAEDNKDDPMRIKIFALNVFCQVLKGVEYIHSKSIIHRDLKPNNIFLCNTGEVKIGDFGLATVCNHTDDASYHPPSCGLSGIHGTLPYSAPEQKTTNNYDVKVDIYSLGIILAELLNPCKTFSEFYRIIMAILEENYPENFRQNWPELVPLIKKLTSSNPKERPSAKEILSYITHECIQVDRCIYRASDGEYCHNGITLLSELLKTKEVVRLCEAKINEMKVCFETEKSEMKRLHEAKINEMEVCFETEKSEMKRQYEAKIDEMRREAELKELRYQQIKLECEREITENSMLFLDQNLKKSLQS